MIRYALPPAILLAAALSGGCGSEPNQVSPAQQDALRRQEAMQAVRMGMTPEQVVQARGQPNEIARDGMKTIWIYRYSPDRKGGQHVVFLNERVIAIMYTPSSTLPGE